MVANVIESLQLGLLIVMAVSPAIFLLCIAVRDWHKAVAVCLFVVSLAGFIGLKYRADQATPNQVNNLYNYGEQVN